MEITVRHAPSFSVGRCALAGGEILRVESGAMMATSDGVGIESGDELDHDGDGRPDGYDVTHGTQVLAVDGTDTVPVYWSQEVSQAQLATDIHTPLSED